LNADTEEAEKKQIITTKAAVALDHLFIIIMIYIILFVGAFAAYEFL
jgi:flagellar basal body-associated protein FliL